MISSIPVLRVLLLIFLALRCAFAADDIVIADFEGADYGGWKAEGAAFGEAPAQGTLPGQMKVTGFLGKGLVNTFRGGDDATGTLTSPPFTIERPFIKFLIGGGGFAGETCVNLRVEGQVVRTATGPNTKPGGSEELDPHSWEVREFLGKSATIEIVDARKGGWGHINADHFVQSEQKAEVFVANPTRELTATARYLHLPVRDGAPKRRVEVRVEGKVERAFDIQLADAEPDWWAFLDIEPWRGKALNVRVDKLREDSRALAALEQSDAIKNSDDLYRERLRPQFHFSARRGWLNDPNGLVFFEGEYHLFFQHNPYGNEWGNMHWGHAVSRDLVHWQDLGEALYPDALGTMFSGCGLVDGKNTSGFGRDGRPPLVFPYTAAGGKMVQCLAYSLDRGRTLTKFPGNPVLDQTGRGDRDPKVFWHEPTARWIMPLYVGLPPAEPGGKDRHVIKFFASPDLKTWTYLSENEGFYECPDFFELPIAGDPAKQRRWVLTGANSNYQVGTFDGVKFTPETPILPGVRGRGFYAAQTYSDIPAEDGRRIQIGWLRAPSPGMPFNQCMSIPHTLDLVATDDGPRLTYQPVRELEKLRAKSHTIPTGPLAPGAENPLAAFRAELLEIEAELDPGAAETITLDIRGTPVVLDAKKRTLRTGDLTTPLTTKSGNIALRIFCDRTTLEIFTDAGRAYITLPAIPPADNLTCTLTAKGGEARTVRLDLHELKSAWSGEGR